VSESNSSSPAGSDERREPRVAPDNMRTSWGSVVDLSPSGVRLRDAGMPPFSEGVHVTLVLQSATAMLDVTCEVAWVQHGFAEFEAGLKFVELNEDDERVLRELCDAHDEVRLQNASW